MEQSPRRKASREEKRPTLFKKILDKVLDSSLEKKDYGPHALALIAFKKPSEETMRYIESAEDPEVIRELVVFLLDKEGWGEKKDYFHTPLFRAIKKYVETATHHLDTVSDDYLFALVQLMPHSPVVVRLLEEWLRENNCEVVSHALAEMIIGSFAVPEPYSIEKRLQEWSEALKKSSVSLEIIDAQLSFLREHLGIKNPGVYSFRHLMRIPRVPSENKIALLIRSTHDWNGGLEQIDTLDELCDTSEENGYTLAPCEATTTTSLIQMLSRYVPRERRAEYVIFMSHGGRDDVVFSDDIIIQSEDIVERSPQVRRLTDRLLASEAPIFLYSCKAGGKRGIGHIFEEVSNRRVTAPRRPVVDAKLSFRKEDGTPHMRYTLQEPKKKMIDHLKAKEP